MTISKPGAFIYVFIVLSTLVGKVYAQNVSLQGKVLNAGSKEPLAFVSVGTRIARTGTLTDIDGHWKLDDVATNDTLVISYVSYKKRKIAVSSLMNGKAEHIILLKEEAAVTEVVITPGVNPAFRIINLAIVNKPQNNWANVPQVTYESYNRFYVTVGKDSVSEKKSKVKLSFGSSSKSANKNDSLSKGDSDEMQKFLDNHYLFLTESIEQTKYKSPDKLYEKIMAAKVSGLSDPRFSIIANEFNHYNFYDELIQVSDKRYLSPIAKGSTKKYRFKIEDTLWSAQKDTIFVISYSPLKGKLFDGFKGTLYINSRNYALQNIIAKPVKQDDGVNLQIQQEFALMEGKYWFPQNINVTIILAQLNSGMQLGLLGIGRSYNKNFNFNPGLKNKDFGAISIEFDKKSQNQDSTYWNTHRGTPLSQKDSNTYHFVDSLGKKMHFDTKLKFIEALFSARLPLGPVDLDLSKIITINDYENIRLGAGFFTNNKISPYFSLGAYAGYGFGDKTWKYGSSLELYPKPGHFATIGVAYSNDFNEFGGTTLMLDRRPLSQEKIRIFYINQMTGEETTRLYYRWRMLSYLQTQLSLNHTNTRVKNNYVYLPTGQDIHNNFHFTEASIGFRYAYKEKIMDVLGKRYASFTNYPIVWLQLTKELPNLLNSNFSYSRFDFKLEKSFVIKLLGTSSFQLRAGEIYGEAPLFREFNMPSVANKQYRVSAQNAFETMSLNEFFGSEYITLFYRHSFEKLLFKVRGRQPILNIVHNFGFGHMDNFASHSGFSYKAMDKGYFEAGASITNFLGKDFYNFGFGAFYRYGPYADTQPMKNLFLKLSFGSSLF